MKVRILGNKLRFRLRQPDVSQLLKQGKVEQITEFGPAPEDRIVFCLEISAEPELSINFNAGVTTIKIPKPLVEEWTSTDMVGFDGRLDTGKGKVVEVLVEKDFECIDDPAQDNEGAYPNPKIVC